MRRSPFALIRKVVFLAIDATLLALVVGILLIVLTGGADFTIAGVPVSVHSAGNPVAIALALGALRYAVRRQAPFLGLRRFPLDQVDRASAHALVAITRTLEGLSRDQVRLFVTACSLAVFGVKVANAIVHPGFVTGDDVEVHEMTLGRLFGESWLVWELRSAFYPMTFIYPVQAALAALGIEDSRTLIVAGRLVVAALSTLALPLLFLAARPHGTGVALVSVLFAATSALLVDYGGTELPRPVSTVFVLGAFVCLARSTTSRSVAGGGLLGLAAAMRFSEALFVVPAIAQLAIARRFGDVALMTVAWCVAAGAIQGASDWLYWGTPFYSAQHIVDFTLVQGLSSRGYEPPWHYLTHVTSWTNYLVFFLALWATALGHWRIAVWAWIPLGLLSLFPHKEARYVIPLVPFVCLLAALGLWKCVVLIRDEPVGPNGFGAVLAVGLILALAGSVLVEGARFHVRRTDNEARFALALAADATVKVLAIERSWRTGGPLYLKDIPALRILDSETLYLYAYVSPDALNQPAADTVAITKNTCRLAGCDERLRLAGFVETSTPFSAAANYRVFRRSGP